MNEEAGLQEERTMPERKRKHRIFERLQPRSAASDSHSQGLLIEKVPSQIYFMQPNNHAFQPLPKKQLEEAEFQAEDEESAPSPASYLENHSVSELGLNTVGSEKFGLSLGFNKQLEEPSVFVRGGSTLINHQSVLFKSLIDIKASFSSLFDETDLLAASVRDLDSSIHRLPDQHSRLSDLDHQLSEMKEQSQDYSKRMEKLEQRLSGLELRQQVAERRLGESQKGRQLKQWMLGNTYSSADDDDEFVETQFLPAHLILEFMEIKKLQALEAQKKKTNTQEQRLAQWAALFHPCLGLSAPKLQRLLGFVLEEFPEKTAKQLSLSLLLRRGTVDMDCDWVGTVEELEYKECLMFVLRCSLGHSLGGFLSNYLIKEEVREDEHAFLFSLQEEPRKLPIRQQFAKEAFEASRHYMVCFGSDLMIAAECLQEESYCEWPNAYKEDRGCRSLTKLAGDFGFMIEHIEVYEVTL